MVVVVGKTEVGDEVTVCVAGTVAVADGLTAAVGEGDHAEEKKEEEG